MIYCNQKDGKMKTKISKPVNLKKLEYENEKAGKLIIDGLSTLSLMINETDPDKLKKLYIKAKKLSKKMVKLAGYTLVKDK